MAHLPATEGSDDYHPMEGPWNPPEPDPDPLLPTVLAGDFQTLQRSLCEEALSRHHNSLRVGRWCGVILETQNVIPPEVGNFDFPYSSTERLGRRKEVTRRTFGSNINNIVIISKQYNRSDFKRAEIELAIASGSDMINEIIGVIWNQHRVQVLQKHFNGVTLTELLQTRHRLGDNEVGLLTYKLLLFLKDLHSRKILHRNIDPDHIMISGPDQRISVVGCSALCNINDSTSEFYRTPYSSPEVARGEEHGYKTDVFSLGCTMLSAVSGKIPYFGTDRQQITLNRILHKIAIGLFPVDQILCDMDTQTSLFQMILDMTKLSQEERLSVNELLKKYFNHREPAWEDWYYQLQGTAAPVDQYRSAPAAPTIPTPSLSDHFGTGNIPSASILESSSDSDAESGEERGEDEGEELPPKPPSDHRTDSGFMVGTYSRMDGSDAQNDMSSLTTMAGDDQMFTQREALVAEQRQQGSYTIKVKEHGQIVCEVKCQLDSLGRDLHIAVKHQMNVAFFLKYENRVIQFHCRLHDLFPLRDVTVTMERIDPIVDYQQCSYNSDEGDIVLDQTGRTGSDAQDDMSSLTAMAGDDQMFTQIEAVVAEQGQDDESLVAEQGQNDGESLMAEQGQDDGEALVAKQGQDDGEALVAKQGQDDGEALVAKQGQDDGEALVAKQGQDDGETLMAEQGQDDGETLVAEPGQDDGETLVAEPGQDDGEALVAKQGQDDGETLMAEQGQDDGEALVAEQGQDDGESLMAEQGQDDGEALVAEPGQDDGEALVAEQGQDDGETLMAEQGQDDGEALVAEPGQDDGEALVAKQGQDDGETLVGEPRLDLSKADKKNDEDDSGYANNLEISELSISDTSQLSDDINSPMSDKTF